MRDVNENVSTEVDNSIVKTEIYSSFGEAWAALRAEYLLTRYTVVEIDEKSKPNGHIDATEHRDQAN